MIDALDIDIDIVYLAAKPDVPKFSQVVKHQRLATDRSNDICEFEYFFVCSVDPPAVVAIHDIRVFCETDQREQESAHWLI